jgi:hypothetical protein
VTTGAARLNFNNSFDAEVFAALGSGVGFGAFLIFEGPRDVILGLPLNSTGASCHPRHAFARPPAVLLRFACAEHRPFRCRNVQEHSRG